MRSRQVVTTVAGLERRLLAAGVRPQAAVIQASSSELSLYGRADGVYRTDRNVISLGGTARFASLGAFRVRGELYFGDRGPSGGWMSFKSAGGTFTIRFTRFNFASERGILAQYTVVGGTGAYRGATGSGDAYLSGRDTEQQGVGIFIARFGSFAG